MTWLRNLSMRINGENYLDGRRGRELREQVRGRTGVVICFRYPPRGAFGMTPDAHWMLVRVMVDDQQEVLGGLGAADPQWVPLEPGSHIVRVVSSRDARVLGTLEISLASGQGLIIDVHPRRKRGLMPGYAESFVDARNEPHG